MMATNRYRIFVSSVQKELAEERRAVKDFITRDPLLSRFIPDIFLFEDIPAQDRKPDDIYLREVEQRDIYLAIFGYEYGWKNEEGKSPAVPNQICGKSGHRNHRHDLRLSGRGPSRA